MAGVSLHFIECQPSSCNLILYYFRHLSRCGLVTHADGNRVSIAIIRLCDSVLSVRTIKPKRLKVKSPNLAQGQTITVPHPPTNIRSKRQRSRSQGQKVRAAPCRCDVTPLNETAPHGLRCVHELLCTLSSAQPLVCLPF